MEQNNENIDINLNISSGTGSTGNSGTALSGKRQLNAWETLKKWFGYPVDESDPYQA